MRFNFKIFIIWFIFVAFFFIAEFLVIFLITDDKEVTFRDSALYFEKELEDQCFSEKAYSRPLFMSSRLHGIAYQPISLGMNLKESSALLKSTKLISCPNFDVIDLKTLASKCKEEESIKIFESNSSFPENYGSTIVRYEPIEKKTNFVFSPNAEFGYVACNDKNDVFLRNVYNQIIADNARIIEEKLKEKYEVKNNYRPLTVIMFITNSVSRRSFYRNMKETVNFFNNSVVSNSSELSKYFVLYDFLGNNAVKDLTRLNMTPFIFGISLLKAVEQEVGKSVDSVEDKDFYLNRQKEKAIWLYYKEKGFVTMHLNDVVSNYLPNIVGRKMLVDHQVSNIWTFAKQFYSYSDVIEKYKCIGSQFSHNHSLIYLSQFLNNYKGYNNSLISY